MTPVESRNSDPVNRVRCFSKSALVSDAVESKWDLVKIKCTQPFNKQVQYGLSFIKLHSTDVKESSNSAKELTSMPQKLFGNFKIREDSPDSDGETSQSLFNRWKVSRNGGDGKGTPQSLSGLSFSLLLSTLNIHFLFKISCSGYTECFDSSLIEKSFDPSESNTRHAETE